MLQLMRKAGCVFINYGIESMDNEALKRMNKNLTTDMIIQGIENTLSCGISPGLNIIFGNLGENRTSIESGPFPRIPEPICITMRLSRD